MKTKLFLVFLATLVSTTTFSQDTTFYIKSFCVADYNKKEKLFKMHRRFYRDFEINIKNKKITIDDGFGTYLEILEKTNVSIDCKEQYYFYCKDNEGRKCNFLWGEDYEKFCELQYGDGSYFYFIKN